MFHVEENVPEVYVNYSRDFQLFCRLYELVFQASKFSIDSMKTLSDSSKCLNSALFGIANKVGLFEQLNVPNNMYREILSAFPYILRNKGSMQSFTILCNLFEKFSNTKIKITPSTDDSSTLIVEFFSYDNYIDIFSQLCDMIRPAGLVIIYVVTIDVQQQTSDYVLSADRVAISTPQSSFNTEEGNEGGVIVQNSSDSVSDATTIDHTFIVSNSTIETT